MWQHNLKLTFRNFRKNKASFLINLIGLSTGLACVLLIYLWVNDEWQMDKFHEKESQLYKVLQNFHLPQGIATWEITPVLLADALVEERPEVEMAVSVGAEEERMKGIVSNGEKEIVSEGIYAGQSFFDVFSFKLKDGNKGQVLKNKNEIVLSEELAVQLFNTTENIIGQNIKWSSQWLDTVFHVAGIFETPPKNSFKKFDFILNIDLLVEMDEYAGKWNGDYAETFILLKEGTDVNKFNSDIRDYFKTKNVRGKSFTLFAHKFSDKYLYGNYENGQIAGGRIMYVKLFSLIALFVLLIACINYMNLSTAQASLKTKEIGVKKTIGATRQNLIAQLLSESTILVFLALIVAVQLVVVLLPCFNQITGKELQLVFDAKSLLVILGVVLLTGFVSGGYSAFYLSGFNPVSILKGKYTSSANEKWVRKGLVVFQFSLSVIFILGVLVIRQQMEYVQNKNLGFNRDNILQFNRPNHRERSAEFISSLKNIPGIVSVSSMYGSILDGTNSQGGYSWRGDEADQNYLFKSPIIGYNAIETLGIDVLAGRTFSEKYKEERGKIIINESARKMMELDEPIGETIGYGPTQRQIIGVVADFNYGSIHHKVEPLIFRFTPHYGNNIMVKIKAGTEKNTIEQIGKTYSDFTPAAHAFNFTFLDADYQALYESEQRVATLSKYFTALAIIISCLGLLGLAMFTAEQRQKEIGIRKVLGASSLNIVGTLSKDYIKLVVIALAFASPVAYYFLNDWLQGFAYHVSIPWWVFALTAFMTVAVALFTVGIHSVKAAVANPVDSLRNE